MTNEESKIRNFYKNQIIFLTGGTGFVGKLLIEKLLRDCYAVEKIYILVRSKRGKNAETRFEEIFNQPCFDRLKNEKCQFRTKVHLLVGQCDQKNLGLSENDILTLIKEVTVVFHAASNVKFDQSLREATANIEAAGNILALCRNIENLKAVIHVSTAFVNCQQLPVREKFGEPPINQENFKNILDALDDKTLEDVTPILLGKIPNAYTFSKSIAEEVVQKLGSGLPVTVFRPAIIMSTASEPMPGWIDNYYGPLGLAMARFLGALKCLHAYKAYPVWNIPCDFVVNYILALGWSTAERCKNDVGDIQIYNYAGSESNTLTTGQMHEYAEEYYWEFPFTKMIWYPIYAIQETKLGYGICKFLLHTLPATLVDFIMVCANKKPVARNIYKKIHTLTDLLSYFVLNKFEFEQENGQKLWSQMNDMDKLLFNFDMKSLDWKVFIRNSVLGAKLYLMKESIETIPSAKRKLILFACIHYIFIAFMLTLIYHFIFKPLFIHFLGVIGLGFLQM